MSIIEEFISAKHKDYPKVHSLIIKEGSENIGEAELLYFGKPFAFYYLFFISINKEFRGNGFGSILLEDLNKFLDRKRKPGLLRNIISKEQPTHTIYAEHNWQTLEKWSDWYVYNLMLVDQFKLDRAIYRVRSIEKSGSFYYK